MTDTTTQAERFRYQVRFAVEGRIRFLSHLETADTLLSSLRRCGVRLALSQGMKPKPLIKVAMPRPVAVEAWDDVVEVELAEFVDTNELGAMLSRVLPAGIAVHAVRRMAATDKSAASQVSGATYRTTLADVGLHELSGWVHEFLGRDRVPVDRSTPKQRREVDVREYVHEMQAVGSADAAGADDTGEVAVRFHCRLTETGSAKPEEVVRALAGVAGRELTVTRTIRESIALSSDGAATTESARRALSEQGAVPAGAALPWGAC